MARRRAPGPALDFARGALVCCLSQLALFPPLASAPACSVLPADFQQCTCAILSAGGHRRAHACVRLLVSALTTRVRAQVTTASRCTGQGSEGRSAAQHAGAPDPSKTRSRSAPATEQPRTPHAAAADGADPSRDSGAMDARAASIGAGAAVAGRDSTAIQAGSHARACAHRNPGTPAYAMAGLADAHDGRPLHTRTCAIDHFCGCAYAASCHRRFSAHPAARRLRAAAAASVVAMAIERCFLLLFDTHRVRRFAVQ